MKTTFISSQALSQATRISLMKQTSLLDQLQKEMSSGRKADVGLDLGIGTGETVSLRREFERLNTIIDTNGLVATRLDVTEQAMLDLRDNAQDFIANLVAVRNSETGRDVVISEAKSNLEQLLARMNTSFNGTYIFAGINTDVSPINDYYGTPAQPNKTAMDAAFLAEFGYAQNDPGVQTMTPAQLDTFLTGAFPAEFDAPGAWNTNWSSASDKAVRNRISTSELIDTSVSANESAFRKLATAYTMVADLGGSEMTGSTFEVLATKAVETLAEAVQEMNTLVGEVGSAQERVSNASTKLSLQTDIINRRINALEAVDPYETSTRLSNVITQIETSYAITARIKDLSLMKYL